MKIRVPIIIGLSILILGSLAFGLMKAWPEASKKPLPIKQPIETAKLASILYELAISENPKEFAHKRGVTLIDNKVEVYITFNSFASQENKEEIIKKYTIFIKQKGSEYLINAIVPVDKLIYLSKESIIELISLPDRPLIDNTK